MHADFVSLPGGTVTEADAICVAKVHPTTAAAAQPPLAAGSKVVDSLTTTARWRGVTKALAALRVEITRSERRNFMIDPARRKSRD